MTRKPQLLVHDHADNVGVVAVEGLAAGTEMLCVVTQDDSDFQAGDAPIDMIRRSARGRHAAAEALGHGQVPMTGLYRSA